MFQSWISSVITLTGISPLPEKVHVVQEFPLPDTNRKLRTFLGLVNFYHRFIPNGETLLHPLHSLLNQTRRPTDKFKWTENTMTAFKVPSQMHLFLSTQPLITDASDIAVGAVLQQYIEGQWCPLAFFSRTLKPAKTHYITYDRELLAIYLAIKHFRYFLEGRDFYVLTD